MEGDIRGSWTPHYGKKKIGKYHNTTKKVAKYTVPQFFNTKWKHDVIPKPLLCMLKLRANKTEIAIKSLLMNISHDRWFLIQTK